MSLIQYNICSGTNCFALIGLICFVLLKAIVPAGFMFSADTHSGMTLCHGDSKSVALMSHLEQGQSYFSESAHHLIDQQHDTASNDYAPKKTVHAGISLCGYSALQLLVFSFVALLVFLFFSYLGLVYRYRSALRPSLYLHALTRAPPI